MGCPNCKKYVPDSYKRCPNCRTKSPFYKGASGDGVSGDDIVALGCATVVCLFLSVNGIAKGSYILGGLGLFITCYFLFFTKEGRMTLGFLIIAFIFLLLLGKL